MCTSSRQEKFVKFSSELTAFTPVELWGTGMVDTYLQTVDKVIGEAVTDKLLSTFTAVSTCVNATQRIALLRKDILGCEYLGPIARAIIKLWYIGTWYELPTAWHDRFGVLANDTTFVPSPNAYIEGLLWTAIGAHPPGAKAQGFGSWQAAPNIPTF